MSGKKARETGLPDADLEMDYIRVALARLVPAEGGQARLLIEKTYKDPKSYFRDGDAIVFSRSLGIRRNAIVLPPGYELISCNVPSQIATEMDGRVRVSFWNAAPGPAALVIRARSLPR